MRDDKERNVMLWRVPAKEKVVMEPSWNRGEAGPQNCFTDAWGHLLQNLHGSPGLGAEQLPHSAPSKNGIRERDVLRSYLYSIWPV